MFVRAHAREAWAASPAFSLAPYFMTSCTHSTSAALLTIMQVRLGQGVPTCMAMQGDLALIGATNGSLFSVSLLRGSNSRVPPPLREGALVCDGLVIGCEEFSEDEEDDEDDGSDEEED